MSWKSEHGEVEDLKSFEIGFKSALSKEWISVNEWLPENQQLVLVLNQENEMAVCKLKIYHEDQQYIFMLHNTSLQIKNVTHWMPLPDPPK